jgi:hypothetical protein
MAISPSVIAFTVILVLYITHAVRKPTIDGGFDEIGGEEGE